MDLDKEGKMILGLVLTIFKHLFEFPQGLQAPSIGKQAVFSSTQFILIHMRSSFSIYKQLFFVEGQY